MTSSWAILNESGNVVESCGGPPITIPENTRVSLRDTLPGVHKGFTMQLGSAEGTAIPSLPNNQESITISIVGPNVEDVKNLHNRMLERVGIRKIHSLSLPLEIKDRWRRFVWLVNWIWTGQTNTT